MLSRLRPLPTSLHFVCTILLAIFAVPAIHHVGLPLRMNVGGMALFYWIGLGPRSILCGFLFCLISSPLAGTIGVAWGRYRKEKVRMFLALIFFVALISALAFPVAVMLTATALGIVELRERTRAKSDAFGMRVISVLGCASYMFVGVILVLVYNDIIVASRLPVSYDHAMNHADTLILGGKTVTDIAHFLFGALPAALLRFVDLAYFQLFILLGAALVISAYESSERGLRFAGTCLTAYYISLLIFYLWPSFGPYIFCARHAAEYPRYLTSFSFQQAGIAGLDAIARRRVQYLGSGYYIAFPSMHIGLPLIAAWFCRPWRPVFWLLAGYTGLAAMAVVVLEWHYLVDVLGGIGTAAIAIVVSALPKRAR